MAPRKPFIPRGAATIRPDGSTDPDGDAFDSHTIYTAWTGDQMPFLEPGNASVTRFYYSGGNGPHSGQRDDSIGLARATTHAYAGLSMPPAPPAGNGIATPRVLTTEPLRTSAAGQRKLWVLASVAADASLGVGLATAAGGAEGAPPTFA